MSASAARRSSSWSRNEVEQREQVTLGFGVVETEGELSLQLGMQRTTVLVARAEVDKALTAHDHGREVLRVAGAATGTLRETRAEMRSAKTRRARRRS